jgi:hypothetical protein
MSQTAAEQTSRKFYPCRRGCGTQITFDNRHKTDAGKFIPLEQKNDSVGQTKLEAHNCSNHNNPKPKEEQQPVTTSQTLSEIRAIKAQMFVLIGRMERLEASLK